MYNFIYTLEYKEEFTELECKVHDISSSYKVIKQKLRMLHCGPWHRIAHSAVAIFLSSFLQSFWKPFRFNIVKKADMAICQYSHLKNRILTHTLALGNVGKHILELN